MANRQTSYRLVLYARSPDRDDFMTPKGVHDDSDAILRAQAWSVDQWDIVPPADRFTHWSVTKTTGPTWLPKIIATGTREEAIHAIQTDRHRNPRRYSPRAKPRATGDPVADNPIRRFRDSI